MCKNLDSDKQEIKVAKSYWTLNKIFSLDTLSFRYSKERIGSFIFWSMRLDKLDQNGKKKNIFWRKKMLLKYRFLISEVLDLNILHSLVIFNVRILLNFYSYYFKLRLLFLLRIWNLDFEIKWFCLQNFKI